MSSLEPVILNFESLGKELDEFEELLKKPSLSETQDVLPFFARKKQLSAFCGALNLETSPPYKVATEFPLYGDFRCDLVVGSQVQGGNIPTYSFIEFESGKPGDIFTKKSRNLPYWAPRFSSGMTQLIDWFWKLDDMKSSSAFEGQFGSRHINYCGILVVGRGTDPLVKEQHHRIDWWRSFVVINSRKIIFLTFDGLYEALRSRFEVLNSLNKS